jgi:chromate transporter
VTSAIEVFFVFLRLGLTSFGGPIAHLGFFHDEFVLKKKWLDEEAYADLVALCQFLPGPATSQVGMAIGLSRAGYLGSFAAWVGFTLPSAVLLIAFAYGSSFLTEPLGSSWLHGLKIVAVAVVAQALWSMSRKMCPDLRRASIAGVALAISLFIPSALGQVLTIVFGGIAGFLFLRNFREIRELRNPQSPSAVLLEKNSLKTSAAFAILFVTLLFILPAVSANADSRALEMFDSFFRAGSLVFGGGHVVLPLLKAEVVNQGWVSADQFMAGYGAVQAVPGPLFSFAAYLGAVSNRAPSGILGALLCLFAIFAPSFLMIFGGLPLWERLKNLSGMRPMMSGINAAVVGVLAAAFYSPVWTSAILTPIDFALAAVCLMLLMYWKLSPVIVVAFGALVSGFIPLAQ